MASAGSRAAYALGIALGVLYLSNLTAGLFELIPDNIPILGNLDEVGATLLIVRCLRGWRGTRRDGLDAARRGP